MLLRVSLGLADVSVAVPLTRVVEKGRSTKQLCFENVAAPKRLPGCPRFDVRDTLTVKVVNIRAKSGIWSDISQESSRHHCLLSLRLVETGVPVHTSIMAMNTEQRG